MRQYLALIFLLFLWTPSVQAAVDVSLTELNVAQDLIFPHGRELGKLDGYGYFLRQSVRSTGTSLTAQYQAHWIDDPWLSESIPQLQIRVDSLSSQTAAYDRFNSLVANGFDEDSKRRLLSSDASSAFYTQSGGKGVDLYGDINAEHHSYHLFQVNGNLLFHASLYREAGQSLNLEQLQQYDKAIQARQTVKGILAEALYQARVSTGVLHPPKNFLYSHHNQADSINLSAYQSLPLHGSLEFDLYVGDHASASGTVLDMSGVSSPQEGDVYLYLNEQGKLLYGIYAGTHSTACGAKGGWIQLESPEAVRSYEWNHLVLNYGVNGFSMSLNDSPLTSCTFFHPKSSRALYLGDYPEDGLKQSFIGEIKAWSVRFSLDERGRSWDSLLKAPPFEDLSWTDPNLKEYLWLKEAGIFTGSNGFLKTEDRLNRAEMMAILIRASGAPLLASSEPLFEDVPQGIWYESYLSSAVQLGMIKGKDNGFFEGDSLVNQAELWTMLARLEGEDGEGDQWYSGGVLLASELGEGALSLAEPVSRREAALILYTYLNE